MNRAAKAASTKVVRLLSLLVDSRGLGIPAAEEERGPPGSAQIRGVEFHGYGFAFPGHQGEVVVPVEYGEHVIPGGVYRADAGLNTVRILTNGVFASAMVAASPYRA
jgi:hypothetical protein